MAAIRYRELIENDIPFIAKILSDWQTEEYWHRRVLGYFNCELHPQQALLPRIMYVATASNTHIVGFIAGHLTKRLGCDGELQWINVIPAYRKTGVAVELLRLLAVWFVKHNAHSICVDVGGESGKRFYAKNGAEVLDDHWMIWRDINILLKG